MLPVACKEWVNRSLCCGRNRISHRLRIVPGLAACIFLLASTTHAPSLLAQSRNRARVAGRVVDASTGEALYPVNVFLAGTTLGDATDPKGRFLIRNIPPGTYELIVTMMGYEVQRMSLHLSPSELKSLVFRLKPRVLPGKEVTVTAEPAREWRKNLKIFERAFFGLNKFARQCKLLNPEVLDFKYDRRSGNFQAFAQQPLRFVNRALGYEVTFWMEEFWAQLYDDELYSIDMHSSMPVLREGSFESVGTARFLELTPGDEGERKKWQANRRIAYNGSVRHFFSALCRNRLKEEGFEIRGVKQFRTIWETEYKLRPESLLKPGVHPDERIFSLPDILNVRYKNEENDIGYELRMQVLGNMKSAGSEGVEYAMSKAARDYAYQESWIEIPAGQSITITTRGLILSAGRTVPIYYGYWRWDSPAEWLPSDYEPPSVADSSENKIP